MEQALTEVCKDIRVGKILIQTSPESGEPGKTNYCYAALKNNVMTTFWELNLSFFRDSMKFITVSKIILK